MFVLRFIEERRVIYKCTEVESGNKLPRKTLRLGYLGLCHLQVQEEVKCHGRYCVIF